MAVPDFITKNLASVHERMARAAARSGRSPDAIELIAVTKTVGPEAVRALWELGVRSFGENRVQELLRKSAALAELDLRWHMIGHLQTNKVGKVVGLVERIHSLDSLHLAQAISNAAARKEIDVKVLIEVNVSGEESKGGVRPDELEPLLEQLGALRSIQVEGLMTMAPFADDPETARPVFRGLRELRDRAVRNAPPNVQLRHLSMGMTRDFPIAIEEGATFVRIGTALLEL